MILLAKKFFSKGPKSKDSKEKPAKDEKASDKKTGGFFSKFAGKKKSSKGKNSSLQDYVSMLNLDEELYEYAVQHISELLSEGDTTQTGFSRNGALIHFEDEDMVLAIAINNFSLAGIYNPNDEAFGSFVNDIQSGLIPTLRLPDDLEQGVLVFLPTADCVESLREYEFLNKVEFLWALVPADLNESSTSTILESTITLSELDNIISNNLPVQLDGDKVIVEGKDSITDNDDDFAFDADDEFEEETDSDDEFDAFEEETDSADEFDEFEDVAEDSFDESFDDALDSADDLFADDDDDVLPETSDDLFGNDGEDSDEIIIDEDVPVIDDDDEIVTAEAEPINFDEHTASSSLDRMLEYKHYNDEFEITITDEAFDRHFNVGNFNAALFSDKINDPNSALEQALLQKKRIANDEILRLHLTNISNLRNSYLVNLSKAYKVLKDRYDIHNPETRFGRAKAEIDANYAKLHQNVHLVVEDEIEKMSAEYQRKREEEGERAKDLALRKYDEENRENFELEKRRVRLELDNRYDRDKSAAERKLLDERRAAFQRDFDQCVVTTILELQPHYQTLQKNELLLIDSTRLKLDKFIRQHYADDVARAKALQSNEDYKNNIDILKKHYNEMLVAKDTELREQLAKNERSDAEWQERYNKMMRDIKVQYDEQVSLLTTKNERLQQSLIELDDTKKAEYKHQIRSLEDIIKGQRSQIDQPQKANKVWIPIVGIVTVIVTLMLGLGGGLLISKMTQPQQPVQQPVQQQPTVYAPQNYYGTNNNDDKETKKDSDEKEETKESTGSTSETKSSTSETQTSTSASNATTQISGKTTTESSK